MPEPTAGDVMDAAMPRIERMRRKFWIEEATHELEYRDPVQYVCLRCQQRHFRDSAIGRRHAAAISQQDTDRAGDRG